MNNDSTATSDLKTPVKLTIIAWLIAGTLDATTAIIVYQIKPMQMFQYIASAAIGADTAFTGEWRTAFLGLCFHYIIALAWTALFFLIFPRIQKFRINRFMLGVFYGAIIWIVMNVMIVPLTQIPAAHRDFKQIAIGMLILMVMIGIPVSLLAHRAYANPTKQQHS